MSLKFPDNPEEAAAADQANKKPSELVLPKALEDVLALKTLRAKELGAEEVLATAGAVIPQVTAPMMAPPPPTGVIGAYLGMDDDSDDENLDGMAPAPPIISKAEGRLDRNRRRKARKKENRKARREQQAQVMQQREKDKEQEQAKEAVPAAVESSEKVVVEEEVVPEKEREKEADKEAAEDEDKNEDEREKRKAKERAARTKDKLAKAVAMIEDELEKVEIEYVPEKVTIADLAPMYRQFYRVFEIFKLESKPKEPAKTETAESEKAAAAKKANEKDGDEDDDDAMDIENDEKERISKRKMKKLTRLSVAELKQLVQRPDVVEMHDVTARDPKLLIQLKSHRNTVQVPRHWCFKRKYLQGKRGIEKPPFELPAFIKRRELWKCVLHCRKRTKPKRLRPR